jgi:hypothetical protein
MFPKKNIGKLCNACNAISLAMDMPELVFNGELKKDAQEKIFTSEKFMQEFVQSSAFKELMVFTWEIQKFDPSQTVRVKYLDDFLEDLKEDTAHAIEELQSNFARTNPDTNVGKLLLNSKAEQSRGILHRLYMGVENYKHFKRFQPDLMTILNINVEQFNFYSQKVPDRIQNETQDVLLKLCTTCDNMDLHDVKKILESFLTAPLTISFMNNLYQTCQVHEMYQTMKWDEASRKETFERMEDPFGRIFAKLNPHVAEEKALIGRLLELNKLWTKELEVIVKRENISSLTMNVPSLSRQHSGLLIFTPSQNDNSVQEESTRRLTLYSNK